MHVEHEMMDSARNVRSRGTYEGRRMNVYYPEYEIMHINDFSIGEEKDKIQLPKNVRLSVACYGKTYLCALSAVKIAYIFLNGIVRSPFGIVVVVFAVLLFLRRSNIAQTHA